jgi:hypothetical protein
MTYQVHQSLRERKSDRGMRFLIQYIDSRSLFTELIMILDL